MTRFTQWLGRTIDAFCRLQRIQFAAPWHKHGAGRC
jgi:hypothetical protein